MIYKMSYNMTNNEELSDKGIHVVFSKSNNINDLSEKYNCDLSHFFFDDNISINPEGIEFYYDSNESNVFEDYLLNNLGWPIVSEKTKELFKKEGITDIKYYPVKLIDTAEKVSEKIYYVIYLTSFIKAYDLEKSKYRYIEKFKVYAFTPMQIVFDTKLCSKYDLFRCIYEPVPIYTSDKVMKLITDNNLSGFDFLRVSK